jgi:FKBP-type peptidyl-prolyl cis-trans isomerase
MVLAGGFMTARFFSLAAAVAAAFALACSAVAAADEPRPAPTTGKPITTASGLQYWDLKVGDGATAASGDIVRVHYTGWLTDGTKFDSSRDHGGEPLRFWLGKGAVIKGWDEGVAGMKAGGKRQLHIPARLGYGPRGSGQIPPNADLIFDVELVAVSK